MKTCLIISGGTYSALPGKIEYDYCIACDSGYDYAVKMGITPHVLLGDFDSMSESTKAEMEKGFPGVEVLTFPIEKDDTDTMLAIKHAIDRGCDRIILSCCLGGRFDHTMANIQSMTYAAAHGCSCELYGDGEWMKTVVPSDGAVHLPYREHRSFSLFSLSDICENLSIEGAKYNASNVTLTNAFPLGHGNSWRAQEAVISIESGILLIVESTLEK